MQAAAANALLKTLEEPASGVYLLLLTAYPLQLLPTIRSRCQRIDLPLPEKTVALAWLAQQNLPTLDYDLLLTIARGAPLSAVNLSQPEMWQSRDIVLKALLDSQQQLSVLSKALSNVAILTVLQLWFSVVNDLSKLTLDHALPVDFLIHKDYADSLRDKATRVSAQALQQFLEKLQQAFAIFQRKIALNQQLLIENLLVQWWDL